LYYNMFPQNVKRYFQFFEISFSEKPGAFLHPV